MLTMRKAVRRTRFLWRALSVFVLAVGFSACAGTGATKPGDLYRSGASYVRLVPIEPGAPANSHPFGISTGELTRLLNRLDVSGAGAGRSVPVFQKEELDTIVPPLVSALSKADRQQDVTFAVIGHPGLLGPYSARSITTGRLFVSDGALNLIFGVVQEPLDIDVFNAGSAPTIGPGTRSRRVDLVNWKIDPVGAHFHGQRDDWLVFAIPNAPAVLSVPATSAAPAGATSGGETPPATTVDSKAREIENKLRVLEELKQRGAITEQEYRERRQEILKEL
jgi:Short C-terminal domain